MLTLISDTGFGSCLIIITLMIGAPLAWWHDAKKKPGAVTPGQNTNTLEGSHV